MQRVQNFGSLLQSYSLKKVLEKIGCEVHFIDIEKNEQENCLTENKSVRFDKEREMNNNLLSKFKKIDRYIINRISNKYFANQQDKMFENISKVYNAFNDRNDVLKLQQKAKQQSVNYLKKYCQ